MDVNKSLGIDGNLEDVDTAEIAAITLSNSEEESPLQESPCKRKRHGSIGGRDTRERYYCEDEMGDVAYIVQGGCKGGLPKPCQDVILVNAKTTLGGVEVDIEGVFDGHCEHGREVAEIVRDLIGPAIEASTKDVDPSFITCQNRDKVREVLSGISNAFVNVNNALAEQDADHGRFQTSGCTAAVTLQRDGHVFYANTGDSVLLYGSVPRRHIRMDSDSHDQDQHAWHKLSTDHNISNAKEHQRLKKAGGRFRQNGAIASKDGRVTGPRLSRAFGDFCVKDCGLIAKPVCGYIKLNPGDKLEGSTDGIVDGMTKLGASPDTNSDDAVKKMGAILSSRQSNLEGLRKQKELADEWWLQDCNGDYSDDMSAYVRTIVDPLSRGNPVPPARDSVPCNQLPRQGQQVPGEEKVVVVGGEGTKIQILSNGIKLKLSAKWYQGEPTSFEFGDPSKEYYKLVGGDKLWQGKRAMKMQDRGTLRDSHRYLVELSFDENGQRQYGVTNRTDRTVRRLDVNGEIIENQPMAPNAQAVATPRRHARKDCLHNDHNIVATALPVDGEQHYKTLYDRAVETICEKDRLIAEKDNNIQGKDRVISEQSSVIKDLTATSQTQGQVLGQCATVMQNCTEVATECATATKNCSVASTECAVAMKESMATTNKIATALLE